MAIAAGNVAIAAGNVAIAAGNIAVNCENKRNIIMLYVATIKFM